MVSMAFHWSSVYTLLFDYKRKDFWQMFAHHVITILLNSYTWTFNFYRPVCLTMVVRYFVDVIQEGGKALHYVKFKRTTSFLFFIFTMMWVITRLVIFSQIIYQSMLQTYKSPPATVFLSGLLVDSMILVDLTFWAKLGTNYF